MATRKEILNKRVSLPLSPSDYTELNKLAKENERTIVGQIRFYVKKGLTTEHQAA